ncbi:hypothetical protein GQX73_g7166 [Xylaria multiplex]|uniref:PD-(D/E)XK nuclease-like domain-containing protein n=1 Tax=Xylaria multiplex TaxID=323545 RepID=A0A7C8MV94_9PEZI|nr:hypothetical protein GQX73_g7166 [Xylaria multiplex]
MNHRHDPPSLPKGFTSVPLVENWLGGFPGGNGKPLDALQGEEEKGGDRDAFSGTSSVSQFSSYSNPAEREAAMRNANDLPLRRIPLEEFLALPSVDPATTLLVQDLSTINQKIGVLPRVLKPLFESQRSILDYLNDAMFTTSAVVGDSLAESNKNLEFQHKRLLRIRKSSLQCSDPARPVCWAEWDNKVHAPILELALDTVPVSDQAPVFHNIKDEKIAVLFRDPNALLRDDLADYGIFLAPAIASPLGSLITSSMRNSRYLARFNALENFEVDRPLAIAIETNRSRAGDANAPNRLANFARAHFRVVRHLFRHLNLNIRTRETAAAETQPSTIPKPPASPPMLPLPLIEVVGSAWRISFAILDEDHVIVSSDLAMGSTEQVSDCYVLFQSLVRLVRWTESECTAWWTGRLQESFKQASFRYVR